MTKNDRMEKEIHAKYPKLNSSCTGDSLIAELIGYRQVRINSHEWSIDNETFFKETINNSSKKVNELFEKLVSTGASTPLLPSSHKFFKRISKSS
jgi:hypothetical protein